MEFMGLIDLTATGNTTLFRKFSLLIGQFLGSELDGYKSTYTVWFFLGRRNLFWKLAYKFWVYTLMKKYPNGMRDVYKRYYQNSNPITIYSKPYFEV